MRLKKIDVPSPGPIDTRVACVFCPGYWETREEAGLLLHSNPPCKKFVDMDVIGFMRATREKLGIPDPVDAG